MGNRSVPSKACQPCRLKRRKCDLKQPGCSQCTRASVKCPGYRDSFSSRLHIETQRIVHKVQESKGQNSTPAFGMDAVSSMQAQNSCAQSTGNSLSRAECSRLTAGLNVDPGQVALSHFMQNYAASSPFSYLPAFHASLNSSESQFDLAVSVPGLVLLSQDLQQPELLNHAYARYAKVLANTQRALNNAYLAVLDSTLVSVLLLSLFEALIFHGRQSPKGWHVHIQGCAALLKIRGVKQFASPLGWHLFLHASNSIRSSCATQAVKVPKALKVLQKKAPSVTGMNYVALQFGFALDEFADLRAQWPHLVISEQLRKCQELDKELDALLALLHKVAPFEKISSSIIRNSVTTVIMYGDGADRYTSPKHAKRWNTVRMLQIMLNDYMYNAISRGRGESTGTFPMNNLSDDESGLYRVTSSRAEQAICGILRSVPSSLEMSESPHLSVKPLILPLASVATSKLAPVSARLFARDRLCFIGSSYGHAQASEAAKVSMETNGLEDWAHLSHFY